MRKVIVFFIMLVLLIVSYCYKDNVDNKNIILEDDKIIEKDNEDNIEKNSVIKILYNDNEKQIDFEDYVLGVVACEMPISFNDEALKAMSVAARTFAMYKLDNNPNYVMKTTTSDQCYRDNDKLKSKWGSSYDKNYSKLKSIIDETKGQYMTYNDEIIISFYFSTSNGYTENCENVFSQKLDYLVSVDSSFESELNYNSKDSKISIKDFFSKLGISESKINSIEIDRSNTGRVNNIIINNHKYKGTKFRKLLGLRSTDFEIKYDSNYVYFTTKGYGHGVGMSQYGANEMAKLGYKYDEILKHYYTGIKIMNK